MFDWIEKHPVSTLAILATAIFVVVPLAASGTVLALAASQKPAPTPNPLDTIKPLQGMR